MTAPTDVNTSVQWIERGDITLRLLVSSLDAPWKAEVVLTHGFGEHADRYVHVAEALATCGLRLWRYDLRGHGRSGGRRGDVADYDFFKGDLSAICETAKASGLPLFLLGHSMGGQITLRFLAEREVCCQGAVILSPWLRLAFAPPCWRRLLAMLAARLWPALVQSTDGLAGRLSRDEAHLAALAHPELTHQQISIRLYRAVQREGLQILAQAPRFTGPLLLLHGAADEVTSVASTEEFFSRLGSRDKELVIYPEGRHELHNDLERAAVLQKVSTWILARAT